MVPPFLICLEPEGGREGGREGEREGERESFIGNFPWGRIGAEPGPQRVYVQHLSNLRKLFRVN